MRPPAEPHLPPHDASERHTLTRSAAALRCVAPTNHQAKTTNPMLAPPPRTSTALRVAAAFGRSEWLAPAVAWALVLAAFDAFMFVRDGRGPSAGDLVAVAGIDALGVLGAALLFDLAQLVRTTLAPATRKVAWAVLGVALALVAWLTAATLVDNVHGLAIVWNATIAKLAIAATLLFAAFSLRARVGMQPWAKLLTRTVFVVALVWTETHFRWSLRESRHALVSAVFVVLSTTSGLRLLERVQQRVTLHRPHKVLFVPVLALAFVAVLLGGPSLSQRAYLRGLVAGRMLYAAHLSAVWRLKKPYAAIRRYAAAPQGADTPRADVAAPSVTDAATPDGKQELALVLTIDALRFDAFESAAHADDSPMRKYVTQSCFAGGAYSPSSDTASTFRALMEARDGRSANWLERLSRQGVKTTLIMNRFVVDHLAARMTPPLDTHFDEVVAPPRTPPATLEADAITKLTLAAAETRAPRHLIWAHHFDVHEWYAERPKRTREEGYRARVQATLSSVAKLLDTLNTGDRRLTVLLFSDHGEGLGHFSTETHGEYLYEPLVRVPYLLWTSDQRCDFASVATASPGPRSTGMTPRLILQRFGLDAPTTPPGDDATIFMSAGFQAAVIVWPHKLIVSPWFVELYDLSQDPSETVNVAASSPEIAQTLTSAISGEGLIDP